MGSIKRKFGNNITSGKFDATDLTGTIPASNVANASLTSVTALPGISGDFIQTVASDPPAPDFGDIWYNSTEQKLKLKVQGTGSWASGGNLNTARDSGGTTNTSGSSLSAGILFGGSPSLPRVANTESYNGTSWTEVNDLNTARAGLAGSGNETAGLAVGGESSSGSPSIGVTETWNGTSWTEVADLNTARDRSSNFGTQTASTYASGQTPGGVSVLVESWNGTSWTEIADVSNATLQSMPVGKTSTAGLVAGGEVSGSQTNLVESWNGTSWTSATVINSARRAGTGFGVQTSGLIVGGTGPLFTATESYDGSSWTELNDLSTARAGLGGFGIATTGVVAGGLIPATNVTEEWEVPTGNQSIQGS